MSRTSQQLHYHILERGRFSPRPLVVQRRRAEALVMLTLQHVPC